MGVTGDVGVGGVLGAVVVVVAALGGWDEGRVEKVQLRAAVEPR